MKMKKISVIAMAMAITCASCGRTTDTMAIKSEPVLQALAQIILDTEKIVLDAKEKAEEENLIVPADCWSETPPPEDTTTSSNTTTPDISDLLDSNIPTDGFMTYEETPEVPENGFTNWDELDPELIEQMGNLVYE